MVYPIDHNVNRMLADSPGGHTVDMAYKAYVTTGSGGVDFYCDRQPIYNVLHRSIDFIFCPTYT